MRQAGRYMPQYRAIRKRVSNFVELCLNPELAVEITLLPEKLLGVDALILFSDILIPLIPMGIEVEFKKGEGPHLKAPSVEDWKRFDPEGVKEVFETVRGVKKRSKLPLIGFSGAPFTLAAYIFEGKTAREYREIRKLFYKDRKTFHKALERLADTLAVYLNKQVEAGADALQIFDSWAGIMSPQLFEEYRPHLEGLIERVKEKHPDVPIIYFFRGGHLFELAKKLPADALSVDWTVNLEKALRETDKTLQGNLDPTVLYADNETIKNEVQNLLSRVAAVRKTKYIFNLGHGLAPDMELEKVRLLVETVKGFRL
jgi:uroporphyrinogen decarboxylase